jgi:hypothetical protein
MRTRRMTYYFSSEMTSSSRGNKNIMMRSVRTTTMPYFTIILSDKKNTVF